MSNIHRSLHVVRQIKRQRQTWEQTLSSITYQRKITVCSVKAESTETWALTHRFQLFRVSPCFLVWLLVCFVNLGVHAVHALCPLSIDHSPLLLTGSTAETSNSVQRKWIAANWLSTVMLWSCSYLLSWIWPSTLCSSFPNMPHGLKFNTHLSPVLGNEM